MVRSGLGRLGAIRGSKTAHLTAFHYKFVISGKDEKTCVESIHQSMII
jgi:hypothetical protein